MSLNSALNLFLEVYQVAISEPSIGGAVAEFARREIPAALSQIIGKNHRYIIHGSPSQDRCANIPWVAIYDRFVSETNRDGFYVVYLVPEDYSGFYLSLNQDAPIMRRIYGPDAKGLLAARASGYITHLKTDKPFIAGPIYLKVMSASSISAYYEQGSIYARYYKRGEIPDDEILTKDLKDFLKLYLLIAAKRPSLKPNNSNEDDEIGLDEEALAKLHAHKHIERNRRLVESVKKIHGYTCQVCGFDFERTYKIIGHEFIEVHYLTPIQALKSQKAVPDPKNDFAVLCANCHRMIHKSELLHHIEGFSAKYVVKQ